MKTFTTILELLLGGPVISDLADLLREHNEEFPESEKKYRIATKILSSEIPADHTPSVDDFVLACEKDIISSIVYAAYLGFKVNLENFHHPIGIDFVHLDTIDYLKDHLFGYFPMNFENDKIKEAFRKSLPEDSQWLYNDIRDYYSFFECSGPKMAHYAGYIVGNRLLPWVEPGYRPDTSQTMAFERETLKFFGMLPL